MHLTDRDTQILELLLLAGFATTPQIRGEFFPLDKDGAVVRDRLRKMMSAGFVQKRKAEVANPLQTGTMPVWIITETGIAALALKKDNPLILNLKPPCTRAWQNFCHYAAVTDFMLLLRRAVRAQSHVKIGTAYFEHTLVNPKADNPAERYRLYTVTSDEPGRKVVCAPDAAFELIVGDRRRAFYLELERGLDMPDRVAAKKAQGFAGMQESGKWKRHFPEAEGFVVLALTPSPGWRDSLRKSIRDRGVGAGLWLFAAINQLTAENLLHGDVMYSTTEGPGPLTPPTGGPTVTVVPNVNGNGKEVAARKVS